MRDWLKPFWYWVGLLPDPPEREDWKIHRLETRIEQLQEAVRTADLERQRLEGRIALALQYKNEWLQQCQDAQHYAETLKAVILSLNGTVPESRWAQFRKTGRVPYKEEL